MKKSLLFSLVVMLIAYSAAAQQKVQKIVFDFGRPDTTDFRVMIRQINNILVEAPDTKIEVVCSGPGLMMLVNDSTNVKTEIAGFAKNANISFAACANTMRRFKINKSQLVPQANVVPVATLEIASKEQEGWSYIKAGH